MIPTVGQIVPVDGLRVRVEAVTDRTVTWCAEVNGGWGVPHTVARAEWIALTSPGWVGPGHAAPGWASADGER